MTGSASAGGVVVVVAEGDAEADAEEEADAVADAVAGSLPGTSVAVRYRFGRMRIRCSSPTASSGTSTVISDGVVSSRRSGAGTIGVGWSTS